MSFNPDNSLPLSLWKDHLATLPNYFLNNPLEEVQSFKHLGLTISHDPSWANHISKLASKSSNQLGILRRTKSFPGTPELLSTNKASICSLMEDWSPSLLGWLPCPTSCSAWCHGNQGLQDHWNWMCPDPYSVLVVALYAACGCWLHHSLKARLCRWSSAPVTSKLVLILPTSDGWEAESTHLVLLQRHDRP